MAKKTAKKKVKKKKSAPRKKSVTKTKPTTKKKAARLKKAKPTKKKTPTKKKAVKKTVKKGAKKAVKKAVKKARKISPKKKPTAKASKKPTRKPKARKTKPTPIAPRKLSPEISKIRDNLLQTRAELLQLLASSQEVERNVGELNFSNEIDLASSLEGREMAFQLSSRDRNELKMIDNALFKIENQTYGICESCSKKISNKRLQILPLTTLCINCQESLELA